MSKMKYQFREGDRFNKLVVISVASYKVLCRCDCGNEVSVFRTNLGKGSTSSCGCSRYEKTTKHGLTKKFKREYGSWKTMIQRCTDVELKCYPKYGGRGITVCPEWIDDFPRFLSDMGSRPVGYTIDRIDNNKGYSKENCRWSSARDQANNRRNTRLIPYQGVEYPLTVLADKLQINTRTLWTRFTNGSPALDAPIKKKF